MIDEADEMLGGEPAPPPRNRGGRPTREEAAAKLLAAQISLKAATSGRAFEDVGGVQAFRRPVTLNFLATVFNHDIQTVTKRLIDCPFTTVGNRKLYEFADAVSYVIKPKMTPEQFVKTLNSSHLPPEINKAFWDGQRSRVKYKIEAQEAWETHEVNQAMGDLCMTMKEGLSTITESMRERAGLTDAQCDLLDAGIEELRTHLMEKLEILATRTTEPSMFGKPMFGAPETMAEIDYADVDAEDE